MNIEDILDSIYGGLKAQQDRVDDLKRTQLFDLEEEIDDIYSDLDNVLSEIQDLYKFLEEKNGSEE